ncbi:MAG: hypothetical protein NZM06_09190 [Chloroherpetonaceae bacterium]|nr:hypothetical protein [Chloroherpetonaceae bacterium]
MTKNVAGTYVGDSKTGTSYIMTVSPEKDFKLEVISGTVVTEYKGSYAIAPLSNEKKGGLTVKLQSNSKKLGGIVVESKYKPNPKYEVGPNGVVWTIESPSKEVVKLTLPPPPTAKLNAPSRTVEKGSSIMLSWKTDNALSVTLNGEKIDANGAKSFSPTTNTLYTLIAEGKGGKCVDTMTVFVVEKQPEPEPLKALQAAFLGEFNGLYMEEEFDEETEKSVVTDKREYRFKFGPDGAFEGEIAKLKGRKLAFKGKYSISSGSTEEIGSIDVSASSSDGLKTTMTFFYEIDDNEPVWTFNDGERFVRLEKK